MKKQKQLARLAGVIFNALGELSIQHLQYIQGNLENLGDNYLKIDKDARMLKTAIQRNWLAAAAKIKIRIVRDLDYFSWQLQKVRNLFPDNVGQPVRYSDIYAELCQLKREYGSYKYCPRQNTLSVITDPVILEDINLGSFEIRLNIGDLAHLDRDSPYEVIALEPNPAGSDSSITHPHVSSDTLCEGDGYIAIRQGLIQGRLNDFYALVIAILNTYNPDSPYIPLSEWDNECRCYDCGYSIGGEDIYYCESCQRDFCMQCSTYCRQCEVIVCGDCARECPACNQLFCKQCTAACTECNRIFCQECLNEDGLCESCEQYRKEKSNEKQETESKINFTV